MPELWDEVGIEPGLEPLEIETGFYFNRENGGKAVINTNDPQVMSRLVNSDFFEMENYRTTKVKRKEVLTYVDGLIPIGSINIGKPRASDSVSKVVKAPKKIYTEEERKKNRAEMMRKLNGKKKRS